MARARDPNRDKAFELFMQHKGEITNRAIAEQLDVLEKTISAWKSRDKWLKKLNGDDCSTTKNECSTTKKKQSNKAKKKADVEEEVVLFENDETTNRQRLFIAYYVQYWNATKAYKKAYDCTYNTARTEGARLLANPCIREEIIKVRDALTEDALLDKRTLIQKWIDIAFADITDYVQFGTETIKDFDDMGNPVEYKVNYTHLSDSAELDGTLITEVKKGKDGITIKLADKMKALEYLSKHMDLLNENEMKQLKLERERIAIRKENGEEDTEHEDDGFFEALGSTAAEVWSEEDD